MERVPACMRRPMLRAFTYRQCLSIRARMTSHFVSGATVEHALVRARSAVLPTRGGCGAKTCRDESRHGTQECVLHTYYCEVRHPPQSGWLDELDRLKGGWLLV